MTLPDSILEVVATEVDLAVGLLGLCAGHEDGKWRYNQLTFDLLNWAADCILTPEELQGFGPSNSLALLGKAFNRIYKTQKFANRGEIGELLLHIILRRFKNSQRVVSRLYFKDASNDTVKGFDAVHVVVNGGETDGQPGLELWLGESKFYKNSGQAVAAVLQELVDHLGRDYLRLEFAAIADKMPAQIPYEQELRDMLSRRTSLDTLFERVVVPVFITYDSEVTNQHASSTSEYLDAVRLEFREAWTDFKAKLDKVDLPRKVRVELILLPMATKSKLVEAFDERLKAWQITTKV